MSANVETMMYVREKPWHGLGTRVEEAPTSADALRIAGLDWTVEQKELTVAESGLVIPNYKANVRSTDGKVLGVVTDRYKIVQNTEAFSFTDNLIGGDVRYETAGSLAGGKKIWLLARLPETEVAGDKTETYLCFSNTHDGTGAVRVCATPVRVVCQNTLNIALGQARRSWSMVHTGNISEKVMEAQHCLEMAGRYMEELDAEAIRLANKTVTDERLKEILNDLFPTKNDATEREQKSIKKMQDEFMVCYFAPDIKKFRGTAWGIVNAASDMAGHSKPLRNTKNYNENNWGRIMTGHYIMDKAYELVGK